MSGVPQLVQMASQSPLQSLGKTMTDLDAIVTQRGKQKYSTDISKKLTGAQSLSDLQGIAVDPSMMTPELQALYESKATQLGALDRLAQEKQMEAERQAFEKGLFEKTDYTPVGDGLFQQFQITRGGQRTPIGNPVTELEMLASKGATPSRAKDNVVMTVDPNNPELPPVAMTESQMVSLGRVTQEAGRKFQKEKPQVYTVGTKETRLAPEVETAMEQALTPIVTGNKEERQSFVKQMFSDMSEGFWTPDTTPTKEQNAQITKSMSEMATNPKWSYNLYNAIQSGDSLEALNLINEYRKAQGQSTFEQESFFMRLVSKLPSGTEGLKTINPTDKASVAAMTKLMQTGGLDQATTTPSNLDILQNFK